MNLLERDEFIKASPAIQIQSKMTHLQRSAMFIYTESPRGCFCVGVSPASV